MPTFHAVSLEPLPGAVAARQAFVATMDTSIIDLAWSADGETLYAYLAIGALGVWPALVHHWPELALIVLGVGFGFGLRWLLRRRARADGPHCRGCDYLLVKCSSDRCPECGLELQPGQPRRGPPARVAARHHNPRLQRPDRRLLAGPRMAAAVANHGRSVLDDRRLRPGSMARSPRQAALTECGCPVTGPVRFVDHDRTAL